LMSLSGLRLNGCSRICEITGPGDLSSKKR
jgi:hypothetical protein